MPKQIHLTQDKVAIVDDSRFDEISHYKWRACRRGNTWYAARHTPRPFSKTVYMHHHILKTPNGMQVDHVNGNGLDNRSVNLRVASVSENQCNRGKTTHNKSGFKGVFRGKWHKKWEARIVVNGKKIQIGSFNTAVEAAHAYDDAALKFHGEFANLNFKEVV